jgi:hypothetical protein
MTCQKWITACAALSSGVRRYHSHSCAHDVHYPEGCNVTTKYSGSCMCGSVRFSFSGAPRFVADCVCESCRRAHGASAVCWVGVRTDQFQVEQGSDLLRWYRSSAESERGFCTRCGTRILFRSSKWPGEVHMAVACISTPHDLVSTGVAFRDEFPSWTALTVAKSD